MCGRQLRVSIAHSDGLGRDEGVAKDVASVAAAIEDGRGFVCQFAVGFV